MYIDKQTQLSDAQAVTAAARSTNYYDAGAARDLGMSKQLYIHVKVGTTVTSGGSSTVQFKVQCDDNSSFSSAKNVIMTDLIPKATLVAGYQFYLPIPPGLNERYVALYYDVQTANLTAGDFSASIVEGIQSNVSYPDAI